MQLDRASSNSRCSTRWRASCAGFAFDDRRPTRDADPLALDLDNDRANVEAKIGSIASIDVADGLALDVASVTSEVIRNRRRPDVAEGLPESFADVLPVVSAFVEPP